MFLHFLKFEFRQYFANNEYIFFMLNFMLQSAIRSYFCKLYDRVETNTKNYESVSFFESSKDIA